jgi:hypothetical protein
MKILRLDMNVNGKEFHCSDAPATPEGFDALMGHNWLLFQSVEEQLRSRGVAVVSATQMQDEEWQEILGDVLDRPVEEGDRVDFCLSLWEEAYYDDDKDVFSGEEYLASPVGEEYLAELTAE